MFTESLGVLPGLKGISPMTRKPRDLTFRKNDAVRAYRAAVAAGIPNPRLEIDREGTIAIFSGDPPKKPDGQADEWDKV